MSGNDDFKIFRVGDVRRKFVRFDNTGNTRVIELMRSNKDWHEYMENKKPVSVHVVGTANGDVVVVKEIK